MRKLMIGLAVILLLLVGLTFPIWHTCYTKLAVDRLCNDLRRTIDGGNLVGSDPKEVIAFLDHHAISHTE